MEGGLQKWQLLSEQRSTPKIKLILEKGKEQSTVLVQSLEANAFRLDCSAALVSGSGKLQEDVF